MEVFLDGKTGDDPAASRIGSPPGPGPESPPQWWIYGVLYAHDGGKDLLFRG
jgi:hypothetical protein